MDQITQCWIIKIINVAPQQRPSWPQVHTVTHYLKKRLIISIDFLVHTFPIEKKQLFCLKETSWLRLSKSPIFCQQKTKQRGKKINKYQKAKNWPVFIRFLYVQVQRASKKQFLNCSFPYFVQILCIRCRYDIWTDY